MSSSLKMTPLLMGVVLLFLFAGRVHAFGAGNIASISKVEGQNCEPPPLTHTPSDPPPTAGRYSY